MRISGGGAWIYEGPGEDYERVGRLASGTVRPVIGRAASAAWWVIVLDVDESAWIADDDGTIQGDTREVAIVSAPPLPGDTTPTPAPTWAPTPNPQCVEPTPDATATTTATVTNTPTASPSASPTAAPTEEATATPQVEAAPLPDDDDGDNLFWLPVAGFVLLAAGAFLYVTRRS